MMNEKAQSMGLRVLIVALLLLVTAVILIAAFTGLFRKETTEIGEHISSLDDKDDDGVANIFDRCCCTSKENTDLVNTMGCAPGEQTKKCKECS